MKLGNKSWIKIATCADRSDFANKTDLASLKPDDGKLDIDNLIDVPSDLSSLTCKANNSNVDKLKTVFTDLKKLSNVVDQIFFENQNVIQTNKL